MADNNVHVGVILGESAVRDAVHFALAPVEAGEDMPSAAHVGVDSTGRAVRGGTLIGIVDPFLPRGVAKGERFYLFLYPQTVTGMRHHWSHPAFDGPQSGESKKSASLQWLKELASKSYAPYEGDRQYTADELIEIGMEYLRTGERHVQQGSENLRDDVLPREFWQHFSAVTGVSVPDDQMHESPFCCTC